MSLFDSNIKNTVITADTIKEVIYSRESFDLCAFETRSEEKLEEIISSVAECIYYRCKAGDWPYDGWEFKESIFGLSFKNSFWNPDTLYEEKRQGIIQYILNRFKELGYTIRHIESKKCFEIRIPNLYASAPYLNDLGKILRSKLVSESCAVPPLGNLFYMDFPASDIGVAGVDDGYTDTIDGCSTP